MRVHLQRPTSKPRDSEEIWLLTVPDQEVATFVVPPPEMRALMGLDMEADFEAERSGEGWIVSHRLPAAGVLLH